MIGSPVENNFASHVVLINDHLVDIWKGGFIVDGVFFA
jgi:hypothetical protein